MGRWKTCSAIPRMSDGFEAYPWQAPLAIRLLTSESRERVGDPVCDRVNKRPAVRLGVRKMAVCALPSIALGYRDIAG